jgi:hypothetical protein
MSQNAVRARESLEQLSAVSGASGVEQRGAKQAYMKAERADGFAYPEASRLADASAPAPEVRFGAPARSSGMMGGMMGRGRSFAPGLGAPAAAGAAPKAAPAPATMMAGMGQAVRKGPEASIRRVGEKTFYLKDRRWVDSAVKPEEDAKAKLVRQFSDEYFALARSQGSELNQYLAFTEPVVVKLDSEVYRIEPAAEAP